MHLSWTLPPALSAIKSQFWDFAGGPVVMNLSANAEDTGSIPGLGRPRMLWGS